MIDFRYLWFALLFACSLVCADDRLFANDRIWIEPQRPTSAESDWYPRAIKSISAKVVRFDAKQLHWVASGQDSETRVSAQRVIWIEPDQRSDNENEAMELFQEGRYADCLDRLPEILRQRPPVWRQQSITMMAAVAASRCGQCKISLELVSQLDRRSLPPVVIAWLPIDWQNHKPSVDAITQANARLSDPSPLVRLVAASWLLSSSDRSEAIKMLETLQRSKRIEVRTFAEMLQWRAATPPQVIESAKGWRRKVDRLPMVWQVGPTKTLIDKFRSAGLTDQSKQLQLSLELTPIHLHP